MKLVIVESPAKAKTINKYLGGDFKVVASFGHIRDLPSKDGSVLPDNDFEMKYVVSPKSTKYVTEICKLAKDASEIYLATDPDREGEAISWHVVEVLRQKKIINDNFPVKRIAFNEITKQAVKDAVASPRYLDNNLIDAQQARRALDYLVGFTLSPVLWRKLPGSKSAGRVQSVALRLICEREDEIERFRSEEYWSILLKLDTIQNKPFLARLSHINGQKLEKFDLTNQKQAEDVKAELEQRQYKVLKIEKKQQKRNPQPPFITSSLQQEASRKLGFSTKKTMQIAQKLYEGVEINGETVGLITYMRTDGVSLSEEAVKSIRSLIAKEFGEEYVPNSPRLYKSKSKNAQEAHEAIRPTNSSFTPNSIRTQLDNDFFKLYNLIWQRTVACQMESAVLDIVSVQITSLDSKYLARASGSTIRFDGFLKLYQEGVDDQDLDSDDGKILPPMNEGENSNLINVESNQHFTEPPPRFSEASLVKKLEELGIGRPSTYSSIISVIQERSYVKLEKKRFYPEERGRIVTAFLVSFFHRYVEYDFTANLEEKLDEVAEGKYPWKSLLGDFWKDFYTEIEKASGFRISEVIDSLNELLAHHLFYNAEKDALDRQCPACKDGQLGLRLGKFGAFIACSNYPECKHTKQIAQDSAEVTEVDLEQKEKNETPLGTDDNGNNIYLKKGPYGWYVQVGENKKGEKPKRMGLPKGSDPDQVTLSLALDLLSLPKKLGMHEEEEVSVGLGKFGPFVKYGKKFISVKDKDILKLTLEEAIEIINNAPKKK